MSSEARIADVSMPCLVARRREILPLIYIMVLCMNFTFRSFHIVAYANLLIKTLCRTQVAIDGETPDASNPLVGHWAGLWVVQIMYAVLQQLLSSRAPRRLGMCMLCLTAAMEVIRNSS
ncbi:hypothetical protein F4777DRAFT_118746 [Nemania sp. FL0916]|nr:hypothetical protein F4777DRAFT_118746 [Nemania sp. FL0916]